MNNSKTKRLVLDWSVLMHANFHKIFTKDYLSNTDTGVEVDEFAFNLASNVLELVAQFDPEEVLLALDGYKNWRVPLYEDHYMENIDYWKIIDEEKEWYVKVDSILYKVWYNDAIEQWLVDKLKKDEIAAMPNLEDEEVATFFEGGFTPDWITEEYPDAPTHVEDHPDFKDGLKVIVPEYKGNRKGKKWIADTSNDEFRKHGRNLAYNMAPLLPQGKAVMCERAEGDDVAAKFVELCNEEEGFTVLVTVDQDLSQLHVEHNNLLIWNPRTRELQKQGPDKASFKLLCKLLGGDTSDNIRGVLFKDRKTPFATVSFDPATDEVKDGKSTVSWIRKIIDPLEKKGLRGAELWGPVYRAIEKKVITPTWEKNLSLIYIPCVPEDIQEEIETLIDEAPTEEAKYNWSDFGIDTTQEKTCENSGFNAAEKWQDEIDEWEKEL
jgi:hypothetical protein|tara:strand:+ start:738 stop:2048 length:1311 start_codon:yes stop_codon:yes gene_type:complete